MRKLVLLASVSAGSAIVTIDLAASPFWKTLPTVSKPTPAPSLPVRIVITPEGESYEYANGITSYRIKPDPPHLICCGMAPVSGGKKTEPPASCIPRSGFRTDLAE